MLYLFSELAAHSGLRRTSVNISEHDFGFEALTIAKKSACQVLIWAQVGVQYTEEQVQDLLHLRRLFYGRQGQLDRQRKVIVSKLCSKEGMTPDGGKYSALTSLAHELHANAAEEQSLMMQCCCACFRGVCVSKCYF